jgi:serine/threonine protein phosphatase PrpC
MPLTPTQLQVDSSRSTHLDLPAPGQGQAGRWTVQTHGMTDRGRTRPRNEDQFLTAILTKALQIQHTSIPQSKMQYSEERGYLFVVADGVGGHQGGEQASALAVGSIEQFVLNTLKWFLHLRGAEGQTLLEEFHAALQQTDANIYKEGRRHPELWGMGTTLTMAYSLNQDLFVAHVGDSRCYLFHQGHLDQITHDHTLVQEMVRHGAIPAEEASHHHLRHVITNVLGSTEPGVMPEVHKVHLEPGDTLLLCSDGLTEMLSDEEIADVLGTVPDIHQACERLIDLANEKGGKDNVTVVLARYDLPEQNAA